MSTTVSDYRFYKVRSSDSPVSVKVSTEFAQVGATTAWIGTRQLANDDENSDRKKWKQEWAFADVGTGKDLAGKLMLITTAVADVRKETDKTGVTYEITGGVDPFTFTLEAPVDQPGGLVLYHVTLDFRA